MTLPSMPPMTTAGAVTSSEPDIRGDLEVPKAPSLPTPPAPEPAPRVEAVKPVAESTSKPARSRIPVAPFSDEDVIQSSEQFLTMFGRLGPQGGSLRIAAGADLELPTLPIEGAGQYSIIAEEGPVRPRIRFRPPEIAPTSPSEWSVMFNLRSGSLVLQGIDLIVPDLEILHAERVAIAGLLRGSKLTIVDCTLSLALGRPSASVFILRSPTDNAKPSTSEPAPRREAVIQIRDSFLRSGGAGVTLGAGRELALEMSNVLVGTEGSLIHAFGSPRRPRRDSPAVEVRMDRVTSRVKGGLVHLESTRDEPDLTSVKIFAENSIVSTTAGDDPLFRVEGQDQFDPIGDKIRWDARKVAYHRIKTYRRDEILQTGTLPRTYDRENWSRAFLPKDESPVLANVNFLHEADATTPAWKLGKDDLRIEPSSPAANLGPDLGKIPAPPPADQL